MLFPDLNLAEGRNCPTGSKPKAGTSSSDILMVLPNKESVYLISKKFFYLTFTIQGGAGAVNLAVARPNFTPMK